MLDLDGEEEAEADKAGHRKANNFHKTNKRFTRYIKYYLKTETCKFGTTCKFHHPREKAGIYYDVIYQIYNDDNLYNNLK